MSSLWAEHIVGDGDGGDKRKMGAQDGGGGEERRRAREMAAAYVKPHGHEKLSQDRKKIIKSLKGHIMKLALTDYGCILLISILSIVDDTKLVTKVVIQELAKHLKQLIFDKDETSESTTEVMMDNRVDVATNKEQDGSAGMRSVYKQIGINVHNWVAIANIV
ncbi:hypothetical protein ABZP36_031808 [Zizania latifolia]